MDQLKIGYFGGTFDPPHLGHFLLAKTALEQNQLDQVFWVLTPLSPLKKKTFSTLEQRIAMVEGIVSGEEKFSLSRVDIDRTAPYYSVDTAMKIRAVFSHEIKLFFIIGADSLKNLPKWYQHQRLVFEVLNGLIVARRPGAEIGFDQLEKEMPGIGERVEFLEMPELPHSSAEIRSRISQGEDVQGYLPEAVQKFIVKEKLYQSIEK